MKNRLIAGILMFAFVLTQYAFPLEAHVGFSRPVRYTQVAQTQALDSLGLWMQETLLTSDLAWEVRAEAAGAAALKRPLAFSDRAALASSSEEEPITPGPLDGDDSDLPFSPGVYFLRALGIDLEAPALKARITPGWSKVSIRIPPDHQEVFNSAFITTGLTNDDVLHLFLLDSVPVGLVSLKALPRKDEKPAVSLLTFTSDWRNIPNEWLEKGTVAVMAFSKRYMPALGRSITVFNGTYQIFNPGKKTSTDVLLDDFPDVENQRIIDAATGNGPIGLKALNEGASFVVGFDQNPLAVWSARWNARVFGYRSRFIVYLADSLQRLPKELENSFDKILGNLPSILPASESIASTHVSLALQNTYEENAELFWNIVVMGEYYLKKSERTSIHLAYASFVSIHLTPIVETLSNWSFQKREVVKNDDGYAQYILEPQNSAGSHFRKQKDRSQSSEFAEFHPPVSEDPMLAETKRFIDDTLANALQTTVEGIIHVTSQFLCFDRFGALFVVSVNKLLKLFHFFPEGKEQAVTIAKTMDRYTDRGLSHHHLSPWLMFSVSEMSFCGLAWREEFSLLYWYEESFFRKTLTSITRLPITMYAILFTNIVAIFAYYYDPEEEGGTALTHTSFPEGDFILNQDPLHGPHLFLRIMRERITGIDPMMFLEMLLERFDATFVFEGVWRGLARRYSDLKIPHAEVDARSQLESWLMEFIESEAGAPYREAAKQYIRGDLPFPSGTLSAA